MKWYLIDGTSITVVKNFHAFFNDLEGFLFGKGNITVLGHFNCVTKQRLSQMSTITGGNTISLELSAQKVAATEEDASVVLDTGQDVRSPKRVALRAAFVKDSGQGSVPLFRAHQMTIIVANLSGVILLKDSGKILEVGNVSTSTEKGT